MTRVPLKDRRLSVTCKFSHTTAAGDEQHLIATFGMDENGHVREAFCASFKAGTDMNVLVADACVVLSLLLQHGYRAEDIRAKLALPPCSIIGTLVDQAIKVENGKLS